MRDALDSRAKTLRRTAIKRRLAIQAAGCAAGAANPERVLSFGEVHYKLVEQYAPPSVLVNEDFDIVHVSESAGKYLRFAGGEPSKSVLKAIHPDLLPDLRAALFSVKQEGAPVEFRDIRMGLDGNGVLYKFDRPPGGHRRGRGPFPAGNFRRGAGRWQATRASERA